MIDLALQRYAVLALASAALFGAAAPALKPIAGALHPVLLAGLLYLGSFLGLAAADALVDVPAEAWGDAAVGPAEDLLCGLVVECASFEPR